MSKQKKVYTSIFLGFSIIMVVLPFLVTANDLLTKLLEKNLLYLFIQKNIVPLEAKTIGVILIWFGYQISFSPTNSLLVVNKVIMGITWNCIGWQSFILFFVSLIVGFKGKYTKKSIMMALSIGVLGTFWLNILRMLFTILLAVHAAPIFRIVFHDYLAAITTVVWLIFFWWFSYSYILEENNNISVK